MPNSLLKLLGQGSERISSQYCHVTAVAEVVHLDLTEMIIIIIK